MSYHFRYNGNWPAHGLRQMSVGLVRVSTAVHKQAVINAPKRTRALANSGKFTQVSPLHYQVVFGGGRVPYARLREYVNHLHPSTRFYLHRAGQSVMANVAANPSAYFKNLI